MAPADDQKSMERVVNLAKRRGLVFPSSDIYGGFRSTWDYGPLGVLLKRNVKDAWWRSMVQLRDDVVGLDAAILMAPRVWEASGHVATFTDPLVDCRNCNERFRADQLPELGELLSLLSQRDRPDRIDPRLFGPLRLAHDKPDRRLIEAFWRGR